ncbi:MAG: hypothetical protein ACXVDD_07090 [Polyangia bacterium]
MMRALACLVALAAGCIVASVVGCDFTVFHHGWPDGLHCSDAGTCPSNGQVCTAELICRHPCTTSADCPANGNADHCDVDGYCRKSCSNGGFMCAQGTGPCDNNGDQCDSDGICHHPCNAGACPMGFQCDGTCNLCRPLSRQ